MKKLLKISAYSYIAVITISFFGVIISGIFLGYNTSLIPIPDYSDLSAPFLILYQLIILSLSVVALSGFIRLGHIFNNKLLVIITYIGIIFAIIYALYLIFGSFIVNIPDIPEPSPPFQNIYDEFLNFQFISYIIYAIVIGIQSIFFGIALIKLHDKVRYSKVAGILNIIGGATMLIEIGNFVMIAAMILEIILLFESSSKLERKKNQQIKSHTKVKT